LNPSYEVLRVRLAALQDAGRAALLGGTATRLFSL
jgi:hypothetical protein